METEGQWLVRRVGWWVDALIVLVLFLLPLTFFWRLVAPDTQDRRVFTYGDFVEQYYPLRRFASGELKSGRWPLWNPNIYAGQPALADIQSGALYPVAWVTAALTGRRDLPFLALEGEAVLHFGLAGVFTYLLARRLTGHRGGALIAALTFILGGYLTSYPSLQLTILETDVWLPVILLCLEQGVRGWEVCRATPTVDYAFIVLGGVALAVALLAGHPQSFTYVFYTSALYLVFRAQGLRLGWKRSLVALALWASVGAGLSAAQWVPTLEFARLSSRASISYAEISAGFTLGDVTQVLWPGRVGQWSPLYIGLLPLALAVLAIWARRGRETAFWGGLALGALVLSLGDRGLLFKAFYLVVPGFRLFRNQERLAFVFSFAMAILAGYGATALTDWLGRRANTTRWVERALIGLMAILVVTDLFRTNIGQTLQPLPSQGYFPTTPALTYINEDRARPFRVSSEGLLPVDGNAGVIYDFQDVTGNSPLHLARYQDLVTNVAELRWWQLLGVRYVLTRRELTHGALVPLSRDADGVNLYRFNGELPRAWVVHRAVATADDDEVHRLIDAPDFDPMRTVVLRESPPLPLPDSLPRGSGPRIGAEVLSYEPTRLVVQANVPANGLLVMGEVYYPGWRATANGRPVPVLLADGLLRAIPLTRGSWRIELVYDPLSFKLGLGLSLLTAAGVAAWIMVVESRKRNEELESWIKLWSVSSNL